MQWSADQRTIFSANLWQGSITRIDRSTSNIAQPRRELKVGQDIRRLALDSDGHVLLATDYLGDSIIIVDIEKWKIEKTLAVGRRPFAVVYQPARNRFWVTLSEDAQLIAIEKGKIVERVVTAETPRGLALTEDGRLLVSHAMTGEVSLFDVAQSDSPTRLIKRIKLHEVQLPDEFASQGRPRLLDDIAISPDGAEAWLPHVLWNFDHEFQFQSTVFPAVSLLDLTQGNEHELVEQRKQLFQTINVIDNNSRTRIVSNPHDAEFSESGAKVYLTLAGSDDLLVFDRSRSGKSNKKRHRRRKQQGGAKAIQIYRHIPGRNPRGLLIENNQLWTQNAVDQTISLLDRGGDHPFDRVTLEQAEWAATSTVIDSAIQRGRALFHSARTDADPKYPVAGDFWMSCNSCHLDGFNFNNRYLVEEHAQDKKQDARSGHPGLQHMVSGNPISDFIAIIQKTQGGLGEDDRDGALPVNPTKPPQPVHDAMTDLLALVTLPHNLPYTGTWLRLEDQSLTHPEQWRNSASCAECHQEMYDQWADSNHRLMGESNPYFKVLLNLAGETEGEAFKSWCLGCHAPQNLMSGKLDLGAKGHMFEKNGASLYAALERKEPDLDEGTGCLFCHRITGIEDAGGNGSFSVNLKDRERYVGEDDLKSELMQWVSSRLINAKPEVHKLSYSQPFYTDPQLCKTCHNEFAPGSGALIVDTYNEWLLSSFNNPADPSKHRSCIDCHMHADVARIGEDIEGRSTLRGPLKKNVVTHQFTGANHHLVGLRNKELERMSIELLRSAGELQQQLMADGQLRVRVTNKGAGHALPTGVADFRQFWLEVRVTDSTGNEVYRSGVLDKEGNLDPKARVFMKEFGDMQGKPVGLLFWRYAKLLSDTRIPADGYRDEIYQLSKDVQFPIEVKTRLLYRIYPQWVTNIVRESEPDLPNPPVVELQSLISRFSSDGLKRVPGESILQSSYQPR